MTVPVLSARVFLLQSIAQHHSGSHGAGGAHPVQRVPIHGRCGCHPALVGIPLLSLCFSSLGGSFV